jgi:hypothetical protein
VSGIFADRITRVRIINADAAIGSKVVRENNHTLAVPRHGSDDRARPRCELLNALAETAATIRD